MQISRHAAIGAIASAFAVFLAQSAAATVVSGPLVLSDTLDADGGDLEFNFTIPEGEVPVSLRLFTDPDGNGFDLGNGISTFPQGTDGGDDEFFTLTVGSTSVGNFNCQDDGDATNILLDNVTLVDMNNCAFDTTFTDSDLGFSLADAVTSGSLFVGTNFSTEVNDFGEADVLFAELTLAAATLPPTEVPFEMESVLGLSVLGGFVAWRRLRHQR